MTRSAALLLAVCAAFLRLSAQTPVPNPTPKTYAQKLVNEALAKHPNVVILALHVVTKDKSEDYPILASNIGRYGKKADEDDLRVIKTGKANLEINKAGNHFEVELPLQDVHKQTIGAIGVVFNYKPGADKLAFEHEATALRDELRAQTPTAERLYGAP